MLRGWREYNSKEHMKHKLENLVLSWGNHGIFSGLQASWHILETPSKICVYVCFFGKKVHSYLQEAHLLGKKPLRTTNLGFPGSASDKEPTCRRPKRCRFNPWVERSPVGICRDL